MAFQYISPMARYVFHLPLRLAERFLPVQCVLTLKNASVVSREFGEYYGSPITESESLQHPLEAILLELGVNIAAICPHHLSNKQEQVLMQIARYEQWNEEWNYSDEDEELDEDVWNGEYTRAKKLKE